ncbi:MAG: hypothetical protein GEU28_05030 [Dehalococcoidia bacterium]|nr:hypothetical protein [Dehalococcoidia bacterium]
MAGDRPRRACPGRERDRSMKSLAVLLAGLAALGLVAAAAAQYPPPVGALEAATSTTVVGAGGETTLSARILDNSGDPIEDFPVQFSIVEEPGDDAALGSKSVSKVTDREGQAFADLYVGTTPGTVIVEVVAGEMRSQITVEVAGGAESADDPGASESGSGPLVATGDGTTRGAPASAWPAAAIVAAFAAFSLTGLGAAVAVRNR